MKAMSDRAPGNDVAGDHGRSDWATIASLVAHAESLPDGTTKVRLLEEAIHRADEANQLRLAFDTRKTLMQASVFGGRGDLVLIHFAWCLAQVERRPDLFSMDEILWQYKWVLGRLVGIPTVSRATIQESTDDFERRLNQSGNHRHAFLVQRASMEASMGRLDEARETQRLYETLPRSRFSDCDACVLARKIGWLVSRGERDEAIRQLESMTLRRMTCATQPQSTFSKMIWPMIEMGDWKSAGGYHRRSYRYFLENPDYLDKLFNHAAYLTVTDSIDALRQGIRRGFEQWPHSTSPEDRQFFAFGVLLFLRSPRGSKLTRLRIGGGVVEGLERGSGWIGRSELEAWAVVQGLRVAEQFDARNGNNSQLERYERAQRIVDAGCIAFDRTRSESVVQKTTDDER
jgi:hypothetical protein